MTSAAATPFELYGKIPANADFMHRNPPRTFVTPWDERLREALSLSRQSLGDAWMSTDLNSPPWHFAINAGVARPSTWLGVLLSSINQVQRYYPLTLAVVALPESAMLVRLRVDFDPLLDRLEEIALALVSAKHASTTPSPVSDRSRARSTSARGCRDLCCIGRSTRHGAHRSAEVAADQRHDRG